MSSYNHSIHRLVAQGRATPAHRGHPRPELKLELAPQARGHRPKHGGRCATPTGSRTSPLFLAVSYPAMEVSSDRAGLPRPSHGLLFPSGFHTTTSIRRPTPAASIAFLHRHRRFGGGSGTGVPHINVRADRVLPARPQRRNRRRRRSTTLPYREQSVAVAWTPMTRRDPPEKYAEILAAAGGRVPPDDALNIDVQIDHQHRHRAARCGVERIRPRHGSSSRTPPGCTKAKQHSYQPHLLPLSNSFVTEQMKGQEITTLLRQGLKGLDTPRTIPSYFAQLVRRQHRGAREAQVTATRVVLLGPASSLDPPLTEPDTRPSSIRLEGISHALISRRQDGTRGTAHILPTSPAGPRIRRSPPDLLPQPGSEQDDKPVTAAMV